MPRRNFSRTTRVCGLGVLELWLCACSVSNSGGDANANSTSSASTPTTSAPGVTALSSNETSSDAPTAESTTPTNTSAVNTPPAAPPSTSNASTSLDETATSDVSSEVSSDDAPDTSLPDSQTSNNTDASGLDATSSHPTSAPDTDELNPGDCSPKADETAPAGYGATATGGGSASPVVVSTFAEADAALSAYRSAYKDGAQTALVLRYTGAFDYATITDVCAQHTKDAQTLNIKEVNNVTFEGTPGSSANFGIKINRAKNVIVRNMTIGLLAGGGDADAITIEGNGTNGDVEHVWIDHNNLFSSTKSDCDGAGDTEFDGLIDIKKGARYITVSYNHLHDHQKTGLLGSSDDDDMDRFVTFHHNWYENVVSRTPLHRFGYVHLYNNYFDRILDSGINVRMGGVALIEANYFENASNPVTSRYSDTLGYWDLRNNHVGANVTWSVTEDTLANADDWQSTTAFPEAELTYDYSPDAANCVKAIVSARAGATL